MEDMRIPGIVADIISGWVSGIMILGPLGLQIFGPIKGSSEIWAWIGGLLGVVFLLYLHARHKKERSGKNTNLQ